MMRAFFSPTSCRVPLAGIVLIAFSAVLHGGVVGAEDSVGPGGERLAGVSAQAVVQVEDIRFEQDGTALAASLHVPRSDAPVPGVVIIHGSGTSDRSNVWARSFAEALSARGYAVLFPDKRGSGESEGDWRLVGFGVLAADAVAGAERARQHAAIDASRVGYLGLSQGGHIAPLAARLDSRAAFAISVVGSLRRMEDQLYDELELSYRDYALDDETIDYLQGLARFSFDYIRAGEGWEQYINLHSEISAGPLALATATWPTSKDDPYWAFWRRIWDYDPVPHWRHVVAQRDLPSLLIYGTGDRNLMVDKSLELATELEPDPDFTVRVYEGGGHALWGQEEGKLLEDMLQELERWLGEATQR